MSSHAADDARGVLVNRQGSILEVTINRPLARNSLDPDTDAALSDVFDAYFADDELRVAIITGAGEVAFCAGADLLRSDPERPSWRSPAGFGGLTRRYLPKPVLAAVNGYAFGGGFELALACHLVVADEAASFALAEVRVGLVAGTGVIRLPLALPAAIAAELILTGRPMSAAEARHYGLVNRVTPPGQALPAARELAEEILAGSPAAVRASLKLMASAQERSSVLDIIAKTRPVLQELMAGSDAREGKAAFAAKRRPSWHRTSR